MPIIIKMIKYKINVLDRQIIFAILQCNLSGINENEIIWQLNDRNIEW